MQISPDIINSLFEGIASGVSILNIKKIYQDKTVKGISVIPTIFFTLWGFWNLYYYPYLSQPFSTIGAVLMTTVNLIWLYYAYKFRKA